MVDSSFTILSRTAAFLDDAEHATRILRDVHGPVGILQVHNPVGYPVCLRSDTRVFRVEGEPQIWFSLRPGIDEGTVAGSGPYVAMWRLEAGHMKH